MEALWVGVGIERECRSAVSDGPPVGPLQAVHFVAAAAVVGCSFFVITFVLFQLILWEAGDTVYTLGGFLNNPWSSASPLSPRVLELRFYRATLCRGFSLHSFIHSFIPSAPP